MCKNKFMLNSAGYEQSIHYFLMQKKYIPVLIIKHVDNACLIHTDRQALGIKYRGIKYNY